ncbi:MAG TPA: hypothetical protein VEI02_01845 [Planctomycetota bacterium]|nr:hypothetical protein [Planctomycetota bacterium]
MLPVKLWIAASARSIEARLGFDPPGDPLALQLHAGALPQLDGARQRRIELCVGGPPSEGWPRVPLVEREPGWYVAGDAWGEIVRAQAAFGRVAAHVLIDDAPAGAAEIEVPVEDRWRRLYAEIAEELRAHWEAQSALRGVSGVGRARLGLWRARSQAEVMLKILARVHEGLDLVASAPDRRPTDGGGRTPHVRSGSRAIAALAQAFRTGAVGLSSDGRPMPLLFPADDQDFDYDTDLNRAARWVVERLAKAALERADHEEALAASRARAPGTIGFDDPRATRRAERLARSLREAARGLRRRLGADRFLAEARRASRPEFPHPLPPTSGYRILREALADDLALRRGGLEEERLRRLFVEAEHEAPALTELYERWVGVRLARALRELGFTQEPDGPAAALPGGAPAGFRSPVHGRLRLHAAPAFRRDRSPVEGVELAAAAGDERRVLTPDYVLERADRRYVRTLLVIDATLSASPDIHRRKALYGRRLASTTKKFRLGAPRRLSAVYAAYAVHPGRARAVESDDPELRSGALALRPGDDAQAALLREILKEFLDARE